MTKIKAWFYSMFCAPYTLACDMSPYYRPWFNEREQLFHKSGWISSWLFAHYWVRKYPYGQARILTGHRTWHAEGKTP